MFESSASMQTWTGRTEGNHLRQNAGPLVRASGPEVHFTLWRSLIVAARFLAPVSLQRLLTRPL
jgi:hypothetical protein